MSFLGIRNQSNYANIFGEIVAAESLIPTQQSTPRKLKVCADFYQQKLIKFPDIGQFHSSSEYWHALLLEADPDVSRFTPQPYKWRIGNRWYTPDCHFIKRGKQYVVEIKPRGEFSEEKTIALEAFCKFHNMQFVVVSNESIQERRIEAKNWLFIVQFILSGQSFNSVNTEHELMAQFEVCKELSYGDIADTGDRKNSFDKELALFRLIHRGLLHAELVDNPIDLSTRISLCE